MRTRSKHGSERPISMTVVRRIPTYLNVVRELREKGEEWVASESLARACDIAPSSVRTDLGGLGGIGITRYGYNLEQLHKTFEAVLGLDRTFGLVIVGAGRLGQALANHQDFGRRGFVLKGVFDNDSRMYGRSTGRHTILPIEELPAVVKRRQVILGAICVPVESAQEAADRLVAAGVRGIWNFAPLQLHVPTGVIVEDAHLSAGLLALAYRLKGAGQTKAPPEKEHRGARRAMPKRRYGTGKATP